LFRVARFQSLGAELTSFVVQALAQIHLEPVESG